MPDTPDLSRPTRLSLPFDPQRDHYVGPLDAPVTLLEYGDFECPDCRQAKPIIEALQDRLGPNRVRFAFRHFPLRTIHSHASVAAQAAEAAAAQGKFWEMHGMLYANQDRMESHDLSRYALRIGLEVYRFESDLRGERFAPRVEADFASGRASGVRGTPTLFINGERCAGPVTFDAVASAVQKAIESASR